MTTPPVDLLAIMNESVLPACGMLTLAMPGRVMHTRPAVTNILCIGLQESEMRYRRQLGADGKPLSGYAGAFSLMQLEHNTVAAITRHPLVQKIEVFGLALRCIDSKVICDTIQTPAGDKLAFILARLLLWCEPRPIPTDCEEAWLQYAGRTWRPGLPRQSTWAGYWSQAAAVTQGIAV